MDELAENQPQSELSEEMQEILRKKEARRHYLASLSFEEKIGIVVELQKRFAPIMHARGLPYFVWKLDDHEMQTIERKKKERAGGA